VLPSLKLQIAGTAFIFIDRHCFTSRWCDYIKKRSGNMPRYSCLKGTYAHIYYIQFNG
jgi:hypothetical protein